MCVTVGDASLWIQTLNNRIRECTHSDNLQISTLLKRDFIYFAYRQQKKDGKVNYYKLLQQVGTENPGVMNFLYGEMYDSGLIEQAYRVYDENGEFMICDGVMKAISPEAKTPNNQFYGNDSYYRLDQPLFGRGGDTAEYFLDLINSRNAPNNLTYTIAQGIADLFTLTVTPNGDFVSINNDDGKSQLLISVLASNETITAQRLGDLAVQALGLTGRDTPIVIVTPSISGVAADSINANKDLFTLWDLSLVVLTHEIKAKPVAERRKVAQRLRELFEHTSHTDSRYLEGHAMRRFNEIVQGSG